MDLLMIKGKVWNVGGYVWKKVISFEMEYLNSLIKNPVNKNLEKLQI